MKYTKKQIKKGFLNWSIHERLMPNEMITDFELANMNVDDLAKEQLNALIYYINNQ